MTKHIKADRLWNAEEAQKIVNACQGKTGCRNPKRQAFYNQSVRSYMI
ncbi:hypothetical protein [Turicimonas muris]